MSTEQSSQITRTHILGPSARLRDLSEGHRLDVERQRVDRVKHNLSRAASGSMIGASLSMAGFLQSTGTPQHAVLAMGAVWLCAVSAGGALVATSSAEKIRQFADRARAAITGRSVEDDLVSNHASSTTHAGVELIVSKRTQATPRAAMRHQ